MKRDELVHCLRQSMDDFRVSKGEKTALAAALAPVLADDRELQLIWHEVFELARQATVDADTKSVLDWLEEISKLLRPRGGSGPTAAAFFSPGDDCLQTIIHRFHGAKKTADVCVFTITDDRVSTAILEAFRRGVRVRIVTDNDKANDEGSDIDRLAKQGVPVRVDHSAFHMHHKFAIFDAETVLSGSYNWTRSAATSNEENLITSDDPKLVAAFQAEFEKLWEAYR